MVKFLMQINTGSVDTEENWLAEMPSWPDFTESSYDGVGESVELKTRQEQFDSLIEVVKDENGDWIDA